MIINFNNHTDFVLEQGRRATSRTDSFTNKSPLPGLKTCPGSPGSGDTDTQKSEGKRKFTSPESNAKSSTDSILLNSQSEKKYLGVRVRMPVRDMLRKIRIAKGLEPIEIQGTPGKASSKAMPGEKRRAHPLGDRKHRQSKQSPKSLEDLAMLVEVLEEDLKASRPYRNPRESQGGISQPYISASSFLAAQQAEPWTQEFPQRSPVVEHSSGSSSPPAPAYHLATDFSPASSPDGCDLFSPLSHERTPEPSPGYPGGFYADGPEDAASSSHPKAACSQISSDYQVPSPPDPAYHSPPLHFGERYSENPPDHLPGLSPPVSYELQQDWNSLSFFHFQLKREESVLRGVPDQELLGVDNSGSILLHDVVGQGKRAPVYAIAKRLAALNRLDTKDAEGKTALHLAAQKNQHLMVADLISLGASVNERDKFGKTPLHLCAENGYVRVLEVLKNSISDGINVEVEATDNNGLTPLHCTVLALNATVKELQHCKTPSEEHLLGYTAVNLAEVENNVELVHFFQRHCCKFGGIDKEDYASQTMLDVSCHLRSVYTSNEASELFRCALLS
ncbi:NF-kappa-B inhibitor zeta isoform X2 [Lepisosteus oculatus]|uniref:NF-kappa-B inhibitor zeta isoform X2 n=1 Tax=Lepisosteus oculatus TaxID=7918 RepID=UPI00073FE48C|nr:PREDICTED: NF-kappa-B inhibitor zeta-like isoform X2 [Lepisosteus oculatus]